MNTLERDAWMEALLAGRLRFHGRADADYRPGYWSSVYKRWAQLYDGDRWRKATESEQRAIWGDR